MKPLFLFGDLANVFFLAWLFLLAGMDANATDIASSPLSSSASADVKPNILLVLDDSSSMSWDYMPDSANSNQRCFGYYGYNRIFYNPSYTYTPPIAANGTPFGSATFTAARKDGYQQGSSTVDLSNLNNLSSDSTAIPKSCSNNCATCNGKNCNNTKYYYSTYTGNGVPGCSDNDYNVVISLSDAEKQNYANWYSYYRTRELFVRTAIGKAFFNLGDKYRIGFTTIYEGSGDGSLNEQTDANLVGCHFSAQLSSDTCKFSLDVKSFDDTQKSKFFSRLYQVEAPASNPIHYTPLRGALMKGGKYFAKKLTNQEYDPLEYSCQQNFVILATDGGWNSNNESSSYGPYTLGNSLVGNPDASTSVPRPLRDEYKSSSGCPGRVGSDGQSNTLSDVALYYYNTDLRTSALGNCTGALGADVCENNVPGAGDDVATYQHMTLFTIGLGVNGNLAYTSNYKQGGSTDYNNITQGTAAWPFTDPTANWNNLSDCSNLARIDDLWHAAVNGRGTYYSAQDPASLSGGLEDALAIVQARNGSSAAAATSSLEPVAGDNYVYVALYTTVRWDGDLKAYTIDPQTGAISLTSLWSAQALLDSKIVGANSGDGRTIYMFSTSQSSKLRSFTYTNLTAENKNSYFDNICGSPTKLSQCSSLTSTQQGMVSGANLVNFLRGQSTYEDQGNNANPLYRDREHALGDIVDSVPVYLKKPPFSYLDAGYSGFVSNNTDRAATIFVAANDGMLHAFDATTGNERWAFVPTAILANLYKLADKNYSSNHQYFVDGSPVVVDICTANCSTSNATWKTILVGGLNAGGRGYYALDVTDPTSPKGLWEFTNDNLGLTFGNPVVTKNKTGTWVVMFASGYNNVNPGDSNGHLFVLNAATGQLLDTISTYSTGTTPVGTTATPSGLAKINVWVNSEVDNTGDRVYGGDLLGNVWRFDFDDNYQPSGKEAFRLAILNAGTVASPVLQPITTKPELAKIDNLYNAVFIGTGRYLGLPDLADTEQQSIYGLKDTLSNTGLGDVRNSGTLVEQTITETTNASGRIIRTSTQNPVDWGTKSGWFVDLNPNNGSPGERVNVDMQLQYNDLTVATNIPATNACNVGGYAYLYNLDIGTGGGLSSAPTVNNASQAAVRLSTNALVAGIKVVKLMTGKTVTIVTDTAGNVRVEENPSPTGAAAGSVKRTMWREIFD